MKEVTPSCEEPGEPASTATPSAATVPSSANRRGFRILRDVVMPPRGHTRSLRPAFVIRTRAIFDHASIPAASSW